MGPNDKKINNNEEEVMDSEEFENEVFLQMTLNDDFEFESADYYDEEIDEALIEEERAILSKYGF